MDDVSFISAGVHHSMAVGTDGVLWAWGSNVFGTLGDGSDTGHYMPIKIMSDIAFVSAAWEHTAAVGIDHALWVWGFNGFGALADGAIMSHTPVMIMDLYVFVEPEPEPEPEPETETEAEPTGNITTAVWIIISIAAFIALALIVLAILLVIKRMNRARGAPANVHAPANAYDAANVYNPPDEPYRVQGEYAPPLIETLQTVDTSGSDEASRITNAQGSVEASQITETGIHCTLCNYVNPLQANFCVRCGKKVS